jgi:GntR family transcriptional regulator/MocR family aminotransferase
MPKKRQNASLELRDRSNGATLFRWLYDEIRTAIVDGRLSPGSRLPSTRSVASQYRMARGTVVAAFDQLAAEGYVESTVGSGTFVRRMLPELLQEARSGGRASLSARGRRLAENPFPYLCANRSVETFRLDRPALDAFPTRLWSRIAARGLRSSAPGLLAHGEILGFRPLRETVAAHVGLTRGVKCTADQVVITTGTQQSLDLISRLVLDPGDRVWMEDPGYVGATALLRAAGAEVIGVPVDAEGIDCDAGRRRFRSAKPIGAGLQVVGWLAKGIEENEACRRAAERGVDSVALSKLTIHRSMSPALVLGVACADIRAIRSGVERLGHALRGL